MFLVENLTRKSANEVNCAIAVNAHPFEFVVRFMVHDNQLRSTTFQGISPRDLFSLECCDEFRAFTKLLWNYFDGASIKLPVHIESDYSKPTKVN